MNPTMPALVSLRTAVDHGDIPGVEVIGQVLPVEFEQAQEQIHELIDGYRPDAVICLGLANGRSEVTPERIAVNLADARIPDNAGALPVDEPVVTDGPAAYFSTLPVKAIVDALTEDSIPASVSMTAGTYVCNTVLYRALHEQSAGTENVPTGFIHVPHPDVMGQDMINRAVQLCVRTVVDSVASA